MLNLALSLLSSLQMGARLKETVDRSLRQAAIVGIAAAVLIAAVVFGLVAAYHALISVYGFSEAGAAGLLAFILALLGVLILLVLRLSARQIKTQPSLLTSPAEGMAMIDQGLGKALQQVSPLTLVAIAFAAGLLASRRR
ncbi:MAG: hypothetical protein ACR2GC_06665 [Methyloceanibacter sp.]|jgi:hypothetical protein|uniref:hypothetical protein n=1 Tax=Methyloceanibacter sp. TaxID=1965321 RepID=UPI003D9B7D0D